MIMNKAPTNAAQPILDDFVERLGKQGYTIAREGEGTERTGKSGATHRFDMVATREDGFLSYTIAIDTPTPDSDEPLGLGAVFAFDDKCYDCGIRDKVILALPGLDDVAKQFARNQHIRVFEKEDIEKFLATPIPSALPESASITQQSNGTGVLESLAALGYRIESNARLTGRSGAEYTFDALATFDDGFIEHRLGIDEVDGPHVTLSRVSVFDAKAYDAGILEKILLASGELTPEARQFADLQRIRTVTIPRPESAETKTPTETETSS